MIPQNQWIDKTIDNCSHVYSDGRNVVTLFETDEDKVDGKNLIAVTALACGVTILMLEVMTTHFHAIVSGPDRGRAKFTDEIARKLGIRANRLGLKVTGDGKIHVREDSIRTENELKDKIMYVYRNAIAAGYPGMPWHYVGGPGDIFFSDHRARISSGRLIRNLPVRTRRGMFHTRAILPAGWAYSENGEIVPDCYIDWRMLESLFRSPKAVLAFMHQNRDKEAAEDALCAREYVRKLGEKELRHIAKEACLRMFGKGSLSKATDMERIAVARKMWIDRCTYSVPALGRAVQMDKVTLEAILIPQK